MRTKLLWIVPAVIVLSAIALAHDPEPVTIVNVEDVSAQGAPLKFWGTGSAYVEPDDEKSVRLSVEENDLWWQNISGKEISRAIVQVYKTDVRGNLSMNIHHLIRGYPAGYAHRMLEGRTFPSGRVRVASLSKHMTAADFQLKPYVSPYRARTCPRRSLQRWHDLGGRGAI